MISFTGHITLEKVLHLQQYEKHMYDSVCCNVSDKASVMYVYTDYYIYMFHFVDSRNAIPEKMQRGLNGKLRRYAKTLFRRFVVDLLYNKYPTTNPQNIWTC